MRARVFVVVAAGVFWGAWQAHAAGGTSSKPAVFTADPAVVRFTAGLGYARPKGKAPRPERERDDVYLVDGSFQDVTVDLVGTPEDLPNARVRVVIRTGSVQGEGDPRLTRFLRDKVLDEKRWPTITFESRALELVDRRVVITGVLEVRGQQQVVSVPFDVSEGWLFCPDFPTTIYRGWLDIAPDAFGMVPPDALAAFPVAPVRVDIQFSGQWRPAPR